MLLENTNKGESFWANYIVSGKENQVSI